MKTLFLVLTFASAALSAAVDTTAAADNSMQTLSVTKEAVFCMCDVSADMRMSLDKNRQSCADNDYDEHDGINTCLASTLGLLTASGREAAGVEAFTSALSIQGLEVDVKGCFDAASFPAEPQNALFQWGKRVKWETLEEAMAKFFSCYEDKAVLNGCVKYIEDDMNMCPMPSVTG